MKFMHSPYSTFSTDFAVFYNAESDPFYSSKTRQIDVTLLTAL